MTTVFWNLVQVSLTTTIVLLPLLLLCTLLRRRYPARVMCVLWVIFAVRLLVPVQNTFPDAPLRVTPHTTLVEVQDTPKPSVPTVSQTEPEGRPEITRQWLPAGTPVVDGANVRTVALDRLLAVIWGLGALLSFAVSMLSYRKFRSRVRRTAQEVCDPDLLAAYQDAYERLKIRRKIPLCMTPAVDGPMLAGIIHPVLLLPMEGIAAADAPLILRHELTHAKHGDVLCKAVFLAARCVHWFNPVVYLLAWQGGQDLEIACDQSVVCGLDTADRKRYGQCILNDAARRMERGGVLTTRLTGGGKAMKTRLTALFSQNSKRRGAALILTAALALTAAGGSFAVTPAAAASDTALEHEIRQTAETAMQAVVDGDVQALLSVLPEGADGQQTAEALQKMMLEADPQVTAYAVYPDAGQAAAYVVKNWSQAVHSSRMAPDRRTVQRMQFIREDGVLKVDADSAEAMCTVQPDDQAAVRDLERFRLLYGDLGLPQTGPAVSGDAAGQIEALLGLSGGRLEAQGATTFRYTFFNGQQIAIYTKPDGAGWKFDRWQAVRKDAQPVDNGTQKQMEALAQRWCDAQLNGVAAEQAERMLGQDLMDLFDAYIGWYDTVDGQTPMQIENMPMGVHPNKAEFAVNAEDGTVAVKLHQVSEGGGRPWWGNVTQTQTLYFGWEKDGLRIVDYAIDQAMEVDDPAVICWTADDVLALGMPEQPETETSLEALVYCNFPVAGGRYRVTDDVVIYTFADGTRIYFAYDKPAGSDSYRLTHIVEPENNAPREDRAPFVPVIQAANQWAEGYLRENALFRYPFMSTALQQNFVLQQEDTGNHLHWFWKIGWGSSPDVTDWMLKDLTADGVTVLYQLEAGGDIYRYAERLTVDTQNGMPVVTGCEALHGTWDDHLTREQFLELYPDDSYALPVNPNLTYMQERADKFQTPESALRAAVGMFYDEEQYLVERAGDEIPVDTGVDQVLKVTFLMTCPDEDLVYISMHQFTDDSGNKLWCVGRIWEGVPDYTI